MVRDIIEGEAGLWRDADPATDALFSWVSRCIGGSYMRSLLCFAGFQCAGGKSESSPEIFELCAGIELLHSFALVHDDLMDGSDMRRGRPSLHRHINAELNDAPVYRESTSIESLSISLSVLVGDLLLALAFRTVSQFDPGTRALFSTVSNEMCVGQYLDLYLSDAGEVPVDRAELVAANKSALYSVVRPLQLGAGIADIGEHQELIADLRAFGMPLGLAFQLWDDHLDAFGSSSETGKPTGLDTVNDRPTLLQALLRDAGIGHAERLSEKARSVSVEAVYAKRDEALSAIEARETLQAHGGLLREVAEIVIPRFQL